MLASAESRHSGTGYKPLEPDWRHGMSEARWWCRASSTRRRKSRLSDSSPSSDQVARFSYQGNEGYGLYEHSFIGPFEKYGMHDRADGAS